VDVIIVHYDTPSLLQCCLASLLSTHCAPIQQIVVVDNASPGHTVRHIASEFPRAEFVFQDSNVGFAAACNEGIRHTHSPYCLILNPDTLITGRDVETIVGSMSELSDAGVVAPRLLNPDGSLQLSCRRFPTLLAVLLRATHLEALLPGPVDEYLMRGWDHAQRSRVDWVIGACMLLRRAAIEEVGLLDEGFFLYYEDTDLAFRLAESGWNVYYDPTTAVGHEHRRESAGLLPRRATRVHLRSLARLFCKHRFAFW
jgi:GT2 family glycosyltransferase